MTRPSQPSKSRLLRLMLAAVAVSASDAAGMPLEGVQEYQGRAGRAKLWQEINVDVYPEGAVLGPACVWQHASLLRVGSSQPSLYLRPLHSGGWEIQRPHIGCFWILFKRL